MSAQRFHLKLKQLKQETALTAGVEWYPWTSLGQFEVLDEMLAAEPGGSTAALLAMIGSDAVLDVGCGDGDIAFFLESLGARVDAVDHAPTNYNALLGVRAIKARLDSPLRFQAADIDTAPELPGRDYGLCVMLGVLYHLKNPFLVLEALARNARHIFLSTRVANFSPDRKVDYGHLPVAYLVDSDELNDDPTNFWIFTSKGLQRVMKRCGWEIVHFVVRGPTKSDPVTPRGDARAYIVARSRLAASEGDARLVEGWHELEHGVWRWTERRFAIALSLRDPLGQARLRFRFHLPEKLFGLRNEFTLRASCGESALAPATYSKPGEHVYQAALGDLPRGLVRVGFELDHAIGPNETDRRELGLLVGFSGEAPFQLG